MIDQTVKNLLPHQRLPGPQQRLPLVLLLVLALGTLGGSPTPAFAQDDHIAPSDWWPQVEQVEAMIKNHKWKAGGKKARKLAETIQRRRWYGSDLRRILADLAFYQAVAEANLGQRERALWHWHMASNLLPRIRKRDLAPYGSAAKLLLEFPLRSLGQMPAGFELRRPQPGQRIEKPVMPELITTPVLNNTGAAIDGSGDCRLELIIDESGQLHQPVIESTHLNPVIIHAVLEWLPTLKGFRPARHDGEPVDTIVQLTIDFHVSRW